MYCCLVRFFFCHYHSEEQTVSPIYQKLITNYNIFIKAFSQSKFQICKKLIRNSDYNMNKVYVNVKFPSHCPHFFQNYLPTLTTMVHGTTYYRSILKSTL